MFFFNDSPTTEIYTLSLHDALPISVLPARRTARPPRAPVLRAGVHPRSEEHTSELQSPDQLVCRLLLEKKNEARGTRGARAGAQRARTDARGARGRVAGVGGELAGA